MRQQNGLFPSLEPSEASACPMEKGEMSPQPWVCCWWVVLSLPVLSKRTRSARWVALDAAPKILFRAANLECLEFGKCWLKQISLCVVFWLG